MLCRLLHVPCVCLFTISVHSGLIPRGHPCQVGREAQMINTWREQSTNDWRLIRVGGPASRGSFLLPSPQPRHHLETCVLSSRSESSRKALGQNEAPGACPLGAWLHTSGFFPSLLYFLLFQYFPKWLPFQSCLRDCFVGNPNYDNCFEGRRVIFQCSEGGDQIVSFRQVSDGGPEARLARSVWEDRGRREHAVPAWPSRWAACRIRTHFL